MISSSSSLSVCGPNIFNRVRVAAKYAAKQIISEME